MSSRTPGVHGRAGYGLHAHVDDRLADPCVDLAASARPASASQQITATRSRASEGVPLADFECVGAILVLRQHPRQAIALVELEQDDLVAWSTTTGCGSR